MREANYIRYRKIKAFGNRLCFLLCRIFPIKRNRISVCTFEGQGGFGCNPKYIAEELHKRSPEYEFVWFVNDMSKQFPDYVKKVPNTIWSRAYYLTTSKIWIDNYRKPYGTCKRKGQYYINTWHATIAFKSIGLWRGAAFSKMAYLVSKNDSDMIDKIVIDSKWCEEVYPKGMVYEGTYLNVGAPRCDILYGDRAKWKNRFREKYNIPLNAKIVMFAPTFREGVNNGKRSVFSGVWSIDFKLLLNSLRKRFGGDWYLCVRIHPQLAADAKEYKNTQLNGKVIDASREDDMSEVLAAMDALVSDYSSVIMDAGYCHMPVFIYADDIEEYLQDRGGLLWNLTTNSEDEVENNKLMTPGINTILPYPVAQNNDELERRIMEFDYDRYESAMKKFERDVQLIFDGKASYRTANQIEKYMEM